MSTKGVAKLTVALLLILGPMLMDRLLSMRDAYFDEVTAKYECEQKVCEADFDGDGVLGRLERVEFPSGTGSSRFLIVIDGGRELIRLPYDYVDGTLRTHAAIRNDAGGARLLIFDGTKGSRATAVSGVFAWDGQELSRTIPSNDDRAILSAMMARDDAGTWGRWGLYRTFSLPLLVGYYLLLSGIFIGYFIRILLPSNPSK